MSALWTVAWHSAWHRRFGLSVVVVSVALSTFLLLAVERVRHDVRENFSQAVSGTDLIVGARTGAVQLMLYTVFRIGNATNTIEWSSVKDLERDPAVAWVVPLSLGDSHRGFPVVGTTPLYFERFQYGARRALRFAQGKPFVGVFDAVLGAEVAARLGYGLGERLVLSHGKGEIAGTDHADKPFKVVGILARTGTPVDRSVHISLAGMQAIHLDWIAGMPLPGLAVPVDRVQEHDLTPKAVTAALVGLKSRVQVFSLQRRIAEYEAEPLPGVALDELWSTIAVGERALLIMSALVAMVSFAGLVAVIVTGLEQRRRELAVLRSIGAGPREILVLLITECILVTVLGALLGALACTAVVRLLGPWAEAEFGIGVRPAWPGATEWALLSAVVVAGIIASLVPGWRAYRMSLADGLSPKG
ncbi:ABC transporter permease [Piscinibacter koreensis]|uniref:ABC transporter permease n=1 Tax=Piscinibacter koreensis TaxID=2742824 RepID=A0A7Y6NP31_9BURK|nr:ABC transporter permease [Schlegelella koreensis]NUZ06684.1 ABC transporter permease [Schlegelella koreensis]